MLLSNPNPTPTPPIPCLTEVSVAELSKDQKNQQGLIEGRVFIATSAFLALIMICAGVASYIIPAGEYVTPQSTKTATNSKASKGSKATKGTKAAKSTKAAKNTKNTKAAKRGQIAPSKRSKAAKKVYKRIKSQPVPFWKILLAPLMCLTGKSGAKTIVLILFILIVGGSFSIMNKSGALPTLLTRLVERFSHRKGLFLVASVFTFALMGATLGLLEEITPMILFFVPIAVSMGWNPLIGMAIPFLSAGFGFAAAMLNPFTVGLAQKYAGLPLFSGLWLRVPFFLICTTLLILYLTWYTKRLEKQKGDSPQSPTEESHLEVDTSMKLGGVVTSLAVGLTSVVLLVVGSIWVEVLQALAFPLIALIFLVMGFAVGISSGTKGGQTTKFFFTGTLEFAPAILLILLAASVGYLFEEGKILATILHNLSQQMSGMSTSLAVILIYGFQMTLNFFVPSGSGQAILTIPILAPLGELLGITRQTVVLAYQCGDGFSNMLWPTNPLLLIALGLSGVSYKDWLLFVLPLQLILALVSIGFLLLAVGVQYGPF